MKTIGFAISGKENEKRRALIPSDLFNIKYVNHLYFEEGYGIVLGYSDEDYSKTGVNVVNQKIVYEQDIICNPKAPEPEELKLFNERQTLFGWIHAVQGRGITDFLLEKKMTAIAWEEMFEDGRHVFWRNNELAGEAAVLHAFLHYGRPPYECSVAILGRGNSARGAIRVLEKMGAKVTVYDRKSIHNFRTELADYDVVVNAVLWDVFRKDRLIYREDLKRMKNGAMIVDISCDEGLEIETSRATTIEDPVYYLDGILHYVVDHAPALFWKTASESLSNEIKKYIDALVEGEGNQVLERATIIKDGKILDEKIVRFQRR
jgi:N5-(carboxyethyl)ornithine synthase